MARRTSQPGRKYFATTAPGLEPVLADELRRLGAKSIRVGSAGVSFLGDKATLVRACLRLRTAHRVLWNLKRFRANSEQDLYRGVKSAARWEHLVDPERTLAISATVRNAAVGDQRYVMLKTKDAIVDAVRDATGDRPSIDARDPDVRVAVRWVGYDVTVSLDAVGTQSLAARGYRTEAGQAPLRETLAAGLLQLAGYRGRRPLVDPFCGSGTIPIEAALIARRVDPGSLRERFGFETWPKHRADKTAELRHQSRGVRLPDSKDSGPIFGLDRDRRILDVARANADRAGVCGHLTLDEADVRRLVRPGGVSGPGLIVGNPPYGERMSDRRALTTMFTQFGEQLRRHFSGWEVWLLMAEEDHVDALGIDVVGKTPLKNGPLDIEAVHFKVP